MQMSSLSAIDGHPIRAFASAWSTRKSPLVVVLPFGSRVRIADAFLSELSEHFNIVTWEARMIIDDPAQDVDLRNLTPQMHAADMMSVMSHYNIERADILGYCSGAGIALLASKIYPSRVGRTALVSGEYVLPTSLCQRSRYQQEVDSLLPIAAESRENAALIAGRLAQRGTQPDDGVVMAAMLPFSHEEYLYRFGVNYLAYRKIDFTDVSRNVEHRALVAVGRKDEQVSVESSVLIHRNLRNGDLHVDPAADHYDVCRGGSPIGKAVWEFLSGDRPRRAFAEHGLHVTELDEVRHP